MKIILRQKYIAWILNIDDILPNNFQQICSFLSVLDFKNINLARLIQFFFVFLQAIFNSHHQINQLCWYVWENEFVFHSF